VPGAATQEACETSLAPRSQSLSYCVCISNDCLVCIYRPVGRHKGGGLRRLAQATWGGRRRLRPRCARAREVEVSKGTGGSEVAHKSVGVGGSGTTMRRPATQFKTRPRQTATPRAGCHAPKPSTRPPIGGPRKRPAPQAGVRARQVCRVRVRPRETGGGVSIGPQNRGDRAQGPPEVAAPCTASAVVERWPRVSHALEGPWSESCWSRQALGGVSWPNPGGCARNKAPINKTQITNPLAAQCRAPGTTAGPRPSRGAALGPWPGRGRPRTPRRPRPRSRPP
jgi:hypothetical protein